jgi:hypothetical protein
VSKQLEKRGFDLNLIKKTFTMICKLDRNSILYNKNKSKNSIDFDQTFIYKNCFDKNVLNINQIIKDSFECIKKLDIKFYENKKIFIINKLQNNLLSLLVHNHKFPFISKNFYKKCNNLNCITCKFSNDKYFIKINNSFSLPLFNNSNCNSENLIYILECKLCFSFYIGQTENIKKRLYQHLYNIKNFIPFHKTCTCVSFHFNLKPHNYKYNFNFYILISNINNKKERNLMETFIIHLFIKLNAKVLNDYIPPLINYYI